MSSTEFVPLKSKSNEFEENSESSRSSSVNQSNEEEKKIEKTDVDPCHDKPKEFLIYDFDP